MKMNEPRMRATRGLRARLFTPVLAGILAAAVALPCAAQSAGSTVPVAPTTPDTTAAASAMGTRLQALYPSTRFGAINPTPWPGVFEVTMGANLAYVDQSGQYFLFGHLYDMKAQRDLTAERKDAIINWVSALVDPHRQAELFSLFINGPQASSHGTPGRPTAPYARLWPTQYPLR